MREGATLKLFVWAPFNSLWFHASVAAPPKIGAEIKIICTDGGLAKLSVNTLRSGYLDRQTGEQKYVWCDSDSVSWGECGSCSHCSVCTDSSDGKLPLETLVRDGEGTFCLMSDIRGEVRLCPLSWRRWHCATMNECNGGFRCCETNFVAAWIQNYSITLDLIK